MSGIGLLIVLMCAFVVYFIGDVTHTVTVEITMKRFGFNTDFKGTLQCMPKFIC